MKHDGPVAMDTTCGFWRVLLYLLLIVSGSYAEENPRILEHPVDQYVAKNEPAKLHCQAEGNPTPEITWYRNGQKVITNKDDQNAHRLLLNGGNQLFFLRIIHTKNLKPDVGTYYCNATNIHGSAISRNATLQIAVLRDEFRESPDSVTVATGEQAVFYCKPPRGEPEPRVIWHKDATPLTLDSRMSISSEGDLTISSVRVSDAAKYTCVATNQAGEKESLPASLTVLEKPTFREMPDDTQANVEDTVELKCRASGDPAPSIQWRREEGRVPFGRARQLDDGTLRIEKVRAADDGVYVCVAENSAGTVEAVGRLSVQTLPSFLITPKDLRVGRGRTATLQCVVTGNPPPTVFWSKGKEQLLMFPHQDHGRLMVSEDGTLRIQRLEPQDQGTFVCQALNSLSNSKVSSVSAVLTVTDDDDRPPPIIQVGPQNLTLESKEVATFTCQAEGNPQPSIRWYKDGKAIIGSDARTLILNSGTLQITDVRVTDSGLYTCKAISETGETDWVASLTVSKQGPYHRMLKLSSFPGAPSKPRASDVTDTSVHLTWVPSDLTGLSPVQSYQVEYFSPQTPQGWQVAPDTVGRESYTVRDLQPNTKYVFLVRARNSQGLSLPSLISDYVRTREKRASLPPSVTREEMTREFNMLRVELTAGEAVNATAVKVSWEVETGLASIQGYLINYTQLLDLDPLRLGSSQSLQVPDPYQFQTYLTGLTPFSWYQVCVRAYAGQLLSQCSNSVKIPTKESVPVAPPENIVIHKEGKSFHIRWSPPPKHQQHGDIKAYEIFCMAEDGSENCSTTAGGRDSSTVIFKVDTSTSYRIKLAARTNKGRGVWSKEYIIGPEQSDITGEPWFVWMLVGSIGGTFWLALCAFSVWLCRRKQRNKKKMAQSGVYCAVPVHKSEESGRASNVMTRDENMYTQKDGNYHGAPFSDPGPYSGLQSDLASLLESGHKHGLDACQVYSAAMTLPGVKGFYHRPSIPSSVAPYATTTLVNKSGNCLPRTGQSSTIDSSFRPINHAYVHSSASGSGDSYQKLDARSADSTSDSSRPNTGHYSYAVGGHHDFCEGMVSPGSDSESFVTDENGMQWKHKYAKPSGCSRCVQGNPATINWSELLPAPPDLSLTGQTPPHPEYCEEQLRLHSNNSCQNTFSDPRCVDSRNLVSPVSKISACSCPVTHDRVVSHTLSNAPNSDFEYTAHSDMSHCYQGDNAVLYQDSSSSGAASSTYNSPRPYSPKPPNPGRVQNTDLHPPFSQSLKPCQGGCGTCVLPLQSLSSSSSSSCGHSHSPFPLPPDLCMAGNPCLACHRQWSDSSQGPTCFGAYPGNTSSSYTQTGGGQYPYNSHYPSYPPVALHGYRMPTAESGNQRRSRELETFSSDKLHRQEGSHKVIPDVDRVYMAEDAGPANNISRGGSVRQSISQMYEAVEDLRVQPEINIKNGTIAHLEINMRNLTSDHSEVNTKNGISGHTGDVPKQDSIPDSLSKGTSSLTTSSSLFSSGPTDPQNSNSIKHRKPQSMAPAQNSASLSKTPSVGQDKQEQPQEQAFKIEQYKNEPCDSTVPAELEEVNRKS